MNARILSAFLLIALSAGPAGAVLAARSDEGPENALETPPITRFIQVGPNLYRGGQPDDEGFAFLRDLGIRTVVSLRNDASERDLVESLGMRFVHIPLTFRPFSTEVPKESVARFFAAVDDSSNGPVFLHCKRGADRTGALMSLYRIARQGWGLERAYDEARDIGMRWWYFPVKGQIQALARALAPSAAAATQ